MPKKSPGKAQAIYTFLRLTAIIISFRNLKINLKAHLQTFFRRCEYKNCAVLNYNVAGL